MQDFRLVILGADRRVDGIACQRALIVGWSLGCILCCERSLICRIETRKSIVPAQCNVGALKLAQSRYFGGWYIIVLL